MILRSPVTLREVDAPLVEWLPGASYFRCPVSGVQFLDGYAEMTPVFPDFSAYGESLLSGSSSDNVRPRRDMPPIEHAALAWATKHLPAGAIVIELFAECGRFSWLLRQAGFQVRVADPLLNHVEMLRRHGFSADLGSCAEVRPNETPQAVFILESIVRVPRPRELLDQIHQRFPRATVYVSAPSMRRSLKLDGVDRRAHYPPDFITRWTAPALAHLLSYGGYRSSSTTVSPMLVRLSPRNWMRRRLFRCLLSGMLRLAGEYEHSVVAWGQPRAAE